MTTPTAEAAGFSGSLRCLKGQPGPEYVVGRILVGMRAVATRQTAEFSLTDAVPGSQVPAPGAPLGSVTGIYLSDHPSGAFSLGVQHAEEHPPSRIQDRLIQSALGRHAGTRLLGRDLKRNDPPAVLASPGADQFLTPDADRISQHRTAVLRTHNATPQVVGAARPNLHFPCRDIKSYRNCLSNRHQRDTPAA